MKRILSFLVLTVLVLTLVACSKDNAGGGGDNNKNEQEISTFYYTYSDTYISSVRSEMDKIFKNASVKFNSYDANGNQTTQTEQVQTAIAKGSRGLCVNVVDTGSNDAAITIINMAKQHNIPVVFFNRSVEESVVSSYDKCVFVGTDYEMAGHMQGSLIGGYLKENFEKCDLNKDGKISYVLFKGQEGNMEAIARTQFAVEDCNKVLEENGLAPLEFYDASNKNKYLVDQDGLWSSAAATNYMSTILARHSESNGNMVELVIANNDEMALGAISALQSAGYNLGRDKAIPVFGVDATDAAKAAIAQGSMVGTIRQDAKGMAETILAVLDNMLTEKEKFDCIDMENVVGTWRVNIPYSTYTGE